VLKTQICVTRPQCVNIIIFSSSGTYKEILVTLQVFEFSDTIVERTAIICEAYSTAVPGGTLITLRVFLPFFYFFLMTTRSNGWGVTVIISFTD